MFLASRDAFSALYGASAHAVEPSVELRGPDFGVTLAVHMAALAAVDHHFRSATTATSPDLPGLSAYLLDRERRHWQTLNEAGAVTSTPMELARVAFVAALTGALPYRDAKGVLEAAGLGAGADRLLTDHATPAVWGLWLRRCTSLPKTCAGCTRPRPFRQPRSPLPYSCGFPPISKPALPR
ncbi:hypothetical protein [Kitasatospora sp. NBC_01266]|uniref:hypothetical protein n=1 Tax=Kitasatospora sp. NBC_01266 TaxID=2903572 RepID=UPI002E35680F|nr:hypothetical protein [Kitasatospora sp. NBC_01266]